MRLGMDLKLDTKKTCENLKEIESRVQNEITILGSMVNVIDKTCISAQRTRKSSL